MDHPETLENFVRRKTHELEAFAAWYRKQQDRTRDDYPDVQLAGDWDAQLLTFEPNLS